MLKKVRFVFKDSVVTKALDSAMSEKDIAAKADDLKAMDMPVTPRPKDVLEPSTMEEVKSILKKCLARDIPVMLTGYSGFGKTQITKQVGTEIPGFPVKADNILDIRAGMMNVEDLRGIPQLVKNEDPTKAFTQSTIPAWLKKVILQTSDNFILFFDEINHASAAVLNSLYGIILERQLEDFKFKERTRIVAAGNTRDQNDDLTELSDPLRRRLEIISIDKAVDNDPDFFEEWLRNKYSELIPKEMLDMLFDPSEKLSDSRSVDIMLEAWAQDIKDADTSLTRSGAIPAGLYSRLQKLYQQKFIRTTGSERHKELVVQVAKFITELEKKKPEYFISNMKAATAEEIFKMGSKAKTTPHSSITRKIGEAARKEIYDRFKDVPEELIEAAINKAVKGV